MVTEAGLSGRGRLVVTFAASVVLAALFIGVLLVMSRAASAHSLGDGVGHGPVSNQPKGGFTTTPTPTSASTDTPTHTTTAISTTSASTPTNTRTPFCGLAWRVTTIPDAESTLRYLNGVAVVSSDDVWAVGYYRTGANIARTLIMHWNGGAWSYVFAPNNGAGDNVLNGLAVISGTDIWAVGAYTAPGNEIRTLTVHWNGTAWSIITSPSVDGNNELKGVAAVARNDVWAVGQANGQTLTMHWNGSTWDVVASPNVDTREHYLTAAAALSANDVWAVGYYFSTQSNMHATLTIHWDGIQWGVVPSFGTFDGKLFGVAAIEADDVWAVGTEYRGFSQFRARVYHWDGSQWNTVSSPLPAPPPTVTFSSRQPPWGATRYGPWVARRVSPIIRNIP